MSRSLRLAVALAALVCTAAVAQAQRPATKEECEKTITSYWVERINGGPGSCEFRLPSYPTETYTVIPPWTLIIRSQLFGHLGYITTATAGLTEQKCKALAAHMVDYAFTKTECVKL